jgi:RNA polymerase sigma factor (sigma-70 family)
MSASGLDRDGAAREAPGEATRRRVAVETYARHEAALRRTARRYSLCADDAEDALQRGLEILLRKAPSEDPRELIRWTQTVVKHEALAVRRERERLLAAAPVPGPGFEDWVALIPSESDGPAERAERRESIARSREALRALKPQELRALTLLAEGFSYAEIGARTGWTRTKVNRCLAEGRDRFRKLLSRSEDGSRCAELAPTISAFCDGEAGPEELASLQEHLRACPHCRSTMRAYRAAPAAAAALAPGLPLWRSVLERAQELAAGVATRLGGGTADSALGQLAGAGGARGAGAAALAKAAALCVGAVGGAACVASGVVPVALPLGAGDRSGAALERRADPPAQPEPAEAQPVYEPSAAPPPAEAEAEPDPAPEPAAATAAEPQTSAGALEYGSSPPPPPAAPAPGPSGSGGDPSGEFGP